MITNIVKDFVYNSCQQDSNKFDPSFFEQHVLLVWEYGNRLAEKLGADKEIVQLSSYLHDISAVLDFNSLPDHHIKSQEIASNILLKHNYPQPKIDMVNKCIALHTSPVQLNKGSAEEICLSNADAIAQIVNPAYWLYFTFSVRKLNFSDGKNWLTNRVEQNWLKLIEPAKQLINKEYYSVRELVKKY